MFLGGDQVPLLEQDMSQIVLRFGGTNGLQQSRSLDLFGYQLNERVTLRLEYEVAQKVGEEIEGDLKAAFLSVQVRF